MQILTTDPHQDEYRLPDGMQRVGYDADEQRYTYRDTDGTLWEGEEGETYGTLHRGTHQITTLSSSLH